MTNEEAIKRLNNRRFTVSMCIDSNDAREENKAIDMAVEALEKQIPKKTTSSYGGRARCCDNCKTDTTRRILIGYERYCPDCGQRIDWSEEN